MNLQIKGSIYGLLLVMFSQLAAIDLTKINLAHHYDSKATVTSNYRLAHLDGSVTVMIAIKCDTLEKWDLHLMMQETYQSEEHDTLHIAPDTLMAGATEGLFSLTLPGEQNKGVLVLAFINPQTREYFLFDIFIPPVRLIPEFYPVDEAGLPVISNYLLSETLTFVSSASAMSAFRYQENFGPADPPMGEMKALAPSLSIDSLLSFEDTLYELANYHFYLIQEDTLDENAVTLLKCPSYYPKYRTLEELIDPLTYITTEAESKTFRQSTNPKKAFEMFWLTTFDTKFRAKSAIRNYYQKVEAANQLFTDYKQGWKTDRGIILIIFGPPDVVLKSERSETWRYDEGTEFEFIKISTLFTSTLYSLKRNRDYDKVWYEQVGQLRKGQ